MKKILFVIIVILLPAAAQAQDDPLRFDASQGAQQLLTMPDGSEIAYMAWENIPYVAVVSDSVYQQLNFYVPLISAERNDMPILLRNYVGGYMAAELRQPSATDATGRALAEGYAVCIPATRGSNSTIETAEGTLYTGRAPAAILDLKAVVRYLRHNDGLMAGSAEKIISDGTSAGGAMSALLGASGNHPVFAPYLKTMGAADERDDIFAAVCYCPITDLDHADMAYEWMYSSTNNGVRDLSSEQREVSRELAEAFPAYLNSLQIKKDDGSLITIDNYLDYVKSFLLASAQKAIDEGCTLADTIGIVRYNAGQSEGPGRGPSDFVTDIDLPTYLNYVASILRPKAPPAFDALGVVNDRPSPENRVFGDDHGSAVNFTTYSLRRATGDAAATLPIKLSERVAMMNPMTFIADPSATTARHWYIRHGARDLGTSFTISINLATALRNNGREVNFCLPWNRPHVGDYNLNDLCSWITTITK